MLTCAYLQMLLLARDISVRLDVFINHAGDTVVRLLLLSISVPSDEFGGIFISKIANLKLNEMVIVVTSSSGPATDAFHK